MGRIKRLKEKIKAFLKRFDITDLMLLLGSIMVFKALFNIHINLGLIVLGLTFVLLSLAVYGSRKGK